MYYFLHHWKPSLSSHRRLIKACICNLWLTKRKSFYSALRLYYFKCNGIFNHYFLTNSALQLFFTLDLSFDISQKYLKFCVKYQLLISPHLTSLSTYHKNIFNSVSTISCQFITRYIILAQWFVKSKLNCRFITSRKVTLREAVPKRFLRPNRVL